MGWGLGGGDDEQEGLLGGGEHLQEGFLEGGQQEDGLLGEEQLDILI